MKLYTSLAREGHNNLTLNDVLKASLSRTLKAKEDLKVNSVWTLEDVLQRIRRDFEEQLQVPVDESIAKKLTSFIKQKTDETSVARGSKKSKIANSKERKGSKPISITPSKYPSITKS
jgi:hypothetical protein